MAEGIYILLSGLDKELVALKSGNFYDEFRRLMERNASLCDSWLPGCNRYVKPVLNALDIDAEYGGFQSFEEQIRLCFWNQYNELTFFNNQEESLICNNLRELVANSNKAIELADRMGCPKTVSMLQKENKVFPLVLGRCEEIKREFAKINKLIDGGIGHFPPLEEKAPSKGMERERF